MPGVVAQGCSPELQRLRQEDWEFRTSEGYIERLLKKQNETINPNPKTK